MVSVAVLVAVVVLVVVVVVVSAVVVVAVVVALVVAMAVVRAGAGGDGCGARGDGAVGEVSVCVAMRANNSWCNNTNTAACATTAPGRKFFLRTIDP